MNDESHTVTESRDCGSDVAAYALGALEPAEVQQFQSHLDTCAVCRDELESFQLVVNTLAMTAPAHRAPARLRRRVRRAVAHEPVPGRATGRRRANWSPARLAVALGAALALAAAGLVGVDLSSSSSGGGSRVIAARVTGAGSAEVRLAGGRGELIVHRFAPPPAGEIYQVWLVRGHGAPIPTTALFSVSASGDGDVEVPGSLHGVTAMMVTPEPAGGSTTPTHPAVITASLT